MHKTKASTTELVLSHDFNEGGRLYWATFLKDLAARGLPHERFFRWNTTATNLDDLLEYATHSSKLVWGSALLLDLEAETGCVAVVWIANGDVGGQLAAETLAAIDAGEAFLRERLPKREATENQTVPIAFWSYGCNGPFETTRSIDVPTWGDIQDNYPSQVAAQLDALMSGDYRPDGRGQLILWYGQPGTGKTYSLRALSWQWRAWCSFHYVTDPEQFFGRSDYMLHVLLDDEYDDDDEERRWKLLILEDTGELLAADAKAQTGQGLSRLLNVVDGIIGQGLRVIVLVTTNDELRQLHPAVSRPGRCLAKIEFVPFTLKEAEAWRARNGVDGDVAAGTLATLFGIAAGDDVFAQRQVGFTL